MRIRYLIALVLIVPGCLAQEIADRLLIPDGIFYYRPAATVSGAEATWVNPAALHRYPNGIVQVMGDFADGSTLESYGVAITGDRVGLAYRYVDLPATESIREFVFAGGSGFGPQIAVGGSYRWFRNGPPELRRQHLWNAALLAPIGQTFQFASVFSNLNRADRAGDETEVEMRYSLGYRPLRGQQLTLAADMFLSTGNKLSEADFVYYAEANPSRGIYLNGTVDNDGNWQAGVRVNLLRYFVGGQSQFADGDHRRTTAYVGFSALRQPSVIPESPQRILARFGGFGENPTRYLFGPRPVGYLRNLITLDRAVHDPGVSEVLLVISSTPGVAQAQELRRAISDARSHGKHVTVYLKRANDLTYYVAAAANRIIMPPVSRLDLNGLAVDLTYYAGVLAKVGVSLDLVRIAEYKTAPERYTRTGPTPEASAQMNRLLDNWFDMLTDGIASGRSLSPDSVRALIDIGPFTSIDAVSVGLIDTLMYADVLTRGGYHSGGGFVSLSRYRADTLVNTSWRFRPRLAVVVAEGEIAQGASQPLFGPRGQVSPGLMARGFGQAEGDPYARGIIFRINSPGGGAFAGEGIHRTVDRSGSRRPLTVSIGNTAASGGMYIATPAATWISSSGSSTGSIGIYGGKADFSGLYEKLDVGTALYTRGRLSAMMSTARPFTDEEREKYRDQLRAFYDHFVDLVATSRDLSVDSIDAIGRGQVWTGREALAIGLVDDTTGWQGAVAAAAESAGLTGRDFDIAVYPTKRSLLPLPAFSILDVATGWLRGSSQEAPVPADPLTRFLDSDGELMLMRMPFDIHLH